MAFACRVCLEILHQTSNYYYFTSYSNRDNITLKDKLADCIPELVLDGADNNVMCEPCFIQLENLYVFKQKCISAQNVIYGYLQQMPMGTELNVHEIAMYYNRHRAIENDSLQYATKNDYLPVETTNNMDIEPLFENKRHMDIEPLFENNKSHMDIEPLFENNTRHMDREPLFETNKRHELERIEQEYESDNAENFLHQCKKCEYSCESEIAFRVHMILHGGKIPPFKCDECNTYSKDEAQLIKHISLHTNETPYLCRRCSYFTVSKEKLLEHKNTKEHLDTRNRYMNTCGECQLIFPNTSLLKRHYKVDHSSSKRKLHCKFCSYFCTNNDNLERHLDNEHDDQDRVPTKASRALRYKCKLCRSKYSSKGDLAFHLRWHSTIVTDRNKCTMCSEELESRGALKKHIKDNHKTCRICNKSVTTFAKLKNHLMGVHNIKLNFAK